MPRTRAGSIRRLTCPRFRVGCQGMLFGLRSGRFPQARAGAADRLDAGMATAEYAIATLAACGFAGLLVAILRGGQVQSMLLGIIKRALSIG